MLSILWNLVVFILTISILITVHEFGHFWVARRSGVMVERFSIGFGKVLWKYIDKYGTEFIISLIPIGGYTKMLDEHKGGNNFKLNHQIFHHKKISQRIFIVVAGPIANFIFSIFIYSLVFINGVSSVRPIVDNVVPNSIAENANIMPNMELKAVDGIKTPDWASIRLQLTTKIGHNSVTISVIPFGSNKYQDKVLDLRHWTFNLDQEVDPVMSLGICPHYVQTDTTLAEVKEKSPASRAGLQKGDKITKVNGKSLMKWITFANLIRNNPKKPILLEVERKGEQLSLILTPDIKLTKEGKQIQGFAGVIPKIIPLPKEYNLVRRYKPLDAIFEAINKTWKISKLTVQLLGKLIIGDVKLNKLSGPLSIAQKAGISAKFGITHYLMFLALISINLGAVNLFPLPVLDGGHLLFLIIEKLKGQPISKRMQEFSYRIGSIILIILMGLALFNDFSRF